MGQAARSSEPGEQPSGPVMAGWYVVYLPRPPQMVRQIHLCLGDRDQGAFVCADGDGKFRPRGDPFFAGARWHGPFSSRQSAESFQG